MSTGAIIMMIVSLALVWGGLVYALIRLPKKNNHKSDRTLICPQNLD